MTRITKRAASVEQQTPKKRRKLRGPQSSPASRNGKVKPLTINEAKASSERLNRALQGGMLETRRGPSAAANGALKPVAQLAQAPPALGLPERLSSVVQKIPASSGSADMDLSDDGAPAAEPDKKTATKARNATPERAHEEALEKSGTDDTDTRREMDEKEAETSASDVESAATESAEQETEPADAEAHDIDMRASPRPDSDISTDDGMELDASSLLEQLDNEYTSALSWSASDEEEHTRSDAADAKLRLQVLERAIESELNKIPTYAWRRYKAELVRSCAKLRAMNYRDRLRQVQEIIYLPEELALLQDGDAERMACAVRMCAVVTEVLGPNDEVIPEYMAAWVKVHVEDIAWKLKATLAARKYWPDAEVMVLDGDEEEGREAEAMEVA